MTYEDLRQTVDPLRYMREMCCTCPDDAPFKHVRVRIFDEAPKSEPRRSYADFSRLVDVCCIAQMLRNFPMTSLSETESERFMDLQQFFFDLENKCLEEAGFE